MRRLVIAVPLLILALLLPAHARAADDPAAVVQQFIAAFNRGDLPAAIALMTPDVRFVGGPCTDGRPCVGTEAVRQLLQGGIAVHSRFTPVGAPVVSGTTVRLRTEVRFDQLAATGVERIMVDVTAEVRENKIASFIQKEDLSDPQTAQFFEYQRTHPSPAPGTMPGLPNTGAGGLARGADRRGAPTLGLLGLLAGLLIVGTWARRPGR